MRIKIQGFLGGKNHSWFWVNLNIGKALLELGHDVEFVSTDGDELFPRTLREHFKCEPNGVYDCQISYTAMINFSRYLAHGDKNRFGIWNYETTKLPAGFSKHVKYCDKFLPSSKFSYDIFAENGISKDKMEVVPHGINVEEFSNNEIYNLNTKKNFKILVNIAQPHIRKNLDGLFESIGKAFTKKDDVCVVIKVNPQTGSKDLPFFVDFYDKYKTFQRKYPNHVETKLITKFFPSMAPIYNACDALFTMTRAECWYLPGTEALATGCINILPRYGGQLDFCNDNNSLLIDGKIGRCNKDMQYWSGSPYATMFYPDIDDAVKKLRYAAENYKELKEKFKPGANEVIEKFTWKNVAKQIENLCID